MTYGAVETITFDVVPTPIVEDVPKASLLTTLTRPQLIEAIAWIMGDIISMKCKSYTSEDEIPEKTVFHAKVLPSITLGDYLTRFSQYAKCEDDALIYAMVYLDRIGEKNPTFCLDTFNVHKLLLVSLAVACKFSDDSYFTNTYYANVGGISAEEFSTLEEEYLVNYLDFSMYVKTDTYNMYYTDIARYYQDKLLQKQCRSQ